VGELLGLTPRKGHPGAPKNALLQKKLLQIEQLPREDQKALIKMIDAMIQARGGGNGSRR
jgi:hypothetical protein